MALSGVQSVRSARRALSDRRMRLGLGLAACMLTAACTAMPGTTTRHYYVAATDHASLKQNVQARGPTGPRGGHAYGLVAVTFLPSFKLHQTGGTCRAKNVKVELALNIVLPKWRGGSTPPARLRAVWSRFERTIVSHEMKHVQISKLYARRMESAISRSASKGGCAELRRQINQRVELLKVRHLIAQNAFDRRTRRQIKRLL